MGIQFITNTQRNKDFYREILYKLINMEGNTLIISTDYLDLCFDNIDNSVQLVTNNQEFEQLEDDYFEELEDDYIVNNNLTLQQVCETLNLRTNIEEELLVVILSKSLDLYEKRQLLDKYIGIKGRNIRVKYQYLKQRDFNKKLLVKASINETKYSDDNYYGMFVEENSFYGLSMYISNESIIENHELCEISTKSYGLAECRFGIKKCKEAIERIVDALKKQYVDNNLPSDISSKTVTAIFNNISLSQLNLLDERCNIYYSNNKSEYKYLILLALTNKIRNLSNEIEYLNKRNKNLKDIYTNSQINLECGSYLEEIYKQFMTLNKDLCRAFDNNDDDINNWILLNEERWFEVSKFLVSCINKFNKNFKKEISTKFKQNDLLDEKRFDMSVIIRGIYN